MTLFKIFCPKLMYDSDIDVLANALASAGVDYDESILIHDLEHQLITPDTNLLVLGEKCFRQVTSTKYNLKAWRGYFLRASERVPGLISTQYMMPTYDIEYHRTNGFKQLRWLYRDIYHFARVCRGDLKIHDYRGTVNMSLEEFSNNYARMAVDIETEGLSNRLTAVGLATNSGWTNTSLNNTAFLNGDRGGRLLIIQNAAYDIPKLAENGIVPTNYLLWDTMYAQQLIDPDAPGYSLNEIASYCLPLHHWKHLGNPSSAPKKTKFKEWKRTFECAQCGVEGITQGSGKKNRRICVACTRRNDLARKIGWEKEAAIYNLIDTRILLNIQEIQHYLLRASGQLDLFELEMDVLRDVLLPMQLRGIRIDQKRQAGHREFYETYASENLRKWNDITGNVNPRSYPQLSKLFYEKWNLPLQYVGGNDQGRSTNSEAINNLREDERVPLIQRNALHLLVGYKRATKWASTYLTTKDRIYPRYGPAKKDDSGAKRFAGLAATGRIIAKGDRSTLTPPIQQFPEAVKDCVVPDNGWFIALDYDSQELIIIAHLSGDRHLLSQIEKGVDIHAHNAKAFGVDRTRAKNLFYGMAFAGKGRALQAALRQHGYTVSLEQVDSFIATGRQLYPQLFAWHNTLVAEAQSIGYIANPFGRRRYFPYDAHKRRSEIVNFPVQATGADLLWKSIRPIHTICSDNRAHLALLQYDSVMIDCRRDYAPTLIAGVAKTMTRVFPEVSSTFRVPVSVKQGPHWGALEETHKGLVNS